MKLIAILVASLLLLANETATAPSAIINDSSRQALGNAVKFLVRNYNEKLGLVSETPGSSVYWLYSDSFLTALVFLTYEPENSSLISFGQNITHTINNYIDGKSLLNQYMVLNSTARAFEASHNVNLTREAPWIKTTVNDGSKELDQSQYADIAFLKALNFREVGDVFGAFASYQAGLREFDGIGFRDGPFMKGQEAGVYQTYKLALCLYAAKTLGQSPPDGVLRILPRLQASDGGFYTGYNDSLDHLGTTNTETTSLSILALTAPARISMILDFYLATAVVAAILLVIMVLTLRRLRLPVVATEIAPSDSP